MREQVEWFNTVIVGGGPAGIAPLLAAHRNGDLDELLDRGVAVVERSHRLGGGAIGQYAINSDSSGRTFVDCLLSDSDGDTELTRLTEHPLTRQLAAAGDGAVALRDAGQFLDLVGAAMARMVAEHKASAVLTGHVAISATRTANGWSVAVRDLATGAERTLLARHVVLATGAEQPAQRLAAERVGGIDLVQRCGGRLVQSGDVLTTGWLETITALLAGKPEPRVVIVGGSTSAAAVAHALLHRLPGVRFGAGGVTLMHRRPLRVYYPDRASALAEGYTEWSEDDVCPISGKVFRFAGFRLDSRELVMQVRGIGGRAPEPRLQLHQLAAEGLDTEAERLLDDADLVDRRLRLSAARAAHVRSRRAAGHPAVADRAAAADGRRAVPRAGRRRSAAAGRVRDRPRRRLPAARTAGRRGELPRPGQRAVAVAARRRRPDRRRRAEVIHCRRAAMGGRAAAGWPRRLARLELVACRGRRLTCPCP